MGDTFNFHGDTSLLICLQEVCRTRVYTLPPRAQRSQKSQDSVTRETEISSMHLLHTCLAVQTWVGGDRQGSQRDPPAKGLPDGRGPGLIIVLLVLVHPHLCRPLCIPKSRERAKQRYQTGGWSRWVSVSSYSF